MIQAKIVQVNEDRELNLTSITIDELVQKIKEWQEWESNRATFEALGKDEKYIDREKKSGWYWMGENK